MNSEIRERLYIYRQYTGYPGSLWRDKDTGYWYFLDGGIYYSPKEYMRHLQTEWCPTKQFEINLQMNLEREFMCFADCTQWEQE